MTQLQSLLRHILGFYAGSELGPVVMDLDKASPETLLAAVIAAGVLAWSQQNAVKKAAD